MMPGDTVVMKHPDGYATVQDGSGRFIGWVPNGITGVVYVLTPTGGRAVVHFDGKLIATVDLDHLEKVAVAVASPVA